MTLSIDLNCDMGESFGAWNMGQDEDIMPYVTSANIACGFHAGDPAVMRKTVAAALKHGVALGAHPGLPDLQGFGRRVIDISPESAYDIVVVQIGALAAVAASQGGRLRHVKAHGALYNMASKSAELSHAIARAVRDVDSSLILYALAGSEQARVGRELGLQVAEEVFGDRSYQDDGSLTSRKRPDAMIVDVNTSIAQVLDMIQKRIVRAVSGAQVPVQADTLCLHGDQPGAVAFAKAIRQALADAGIQIRSVAPAMAAA